MEQRPTLHIIDPCSRQRAQLAHTGKAIGHHCEVYGSPIEFLDWSPRSGIVLVTEEASGQSSAASIVATLAEHGRWLPVIALHEAPEPSAIVAAMKAGVLDFLVLHLDDPTLCAKLAAIEEEVAAHAAAKAQAAKAWQQVKALTKRERGVLDWLVQGCSNKLIARNLTISPRTVEIHRANMMIKLKARHAAEAIRLRLEAEPVLQRSASV